MIDAGLLNEVTYIYKHYKLPNAIGYKEFNSYFKNENSLEQVIEDIKKNTRHLAKRQITWFKNQLNANFYDIDLNNFENTIEEVYEDVCKFLKGN
ncbi:MAG: tRNA (adenosine(37)-N6)-dimethylallyltransferase MiaA, partial [Anaeroplasmataceae bacterium]